MGKYYVIRTEKNGYVGQIDEAEFNWMDNVDNAHLFCEEDTALDMAYQFCLINYSIVPVKITVEVL
jgi:hypothetical protein